MLALALLQASVAAEASGGVSLGISAREAMRGELGRGLSGAASRVFEVQVQPGADPDPDADPSDEEDVILLPPGAPAPGLRGPSLPGLRGGHPGLLREDPQNERPLPPFSETARDVPSVEVLHRIARTAGWSMTLIGVGNETIDVDLRNVDPRQAALEVLRASHSMGVLRGGKLIVFPSPGKSQSGTLIEQRGSRGPSRKRRAGNDIVKIFRDVTVPSGTVLHGDAVAIFGPVEVEPGAVVEGNAVSILGGLQVDNGGVVLGDGVSVLGPLEIERGGQVLGEHVQVGAGRIFGEPRRRPSSRGFFSRLGPFGFFPTLALFAILYLCGLFALRAWPERVRGVAVSILGQPVRSFCIGFLSWLLLVPLAVLLCVSVVGIVLVPLLPLALFLSLALGLSAVALRIGESLPAGPGQHFVPPAALGMGIAVLLLVSFVPWVGVPLLALTQFFALGGALGSRLGRSST
ncbi:MAG: hypothetical protein NVSMB23_16200 [Myxococcales bacterium]